MDRRPAIRRDSFVGCGGDVSLGCLRDRLYRFLSLSKNKRRKDIGRVQYSEDSKIFVLEIKSGKIWHRLSFANSKKNELLPEEVTFLTDSAQVEVFGVGKIPFSIQQLFEIGFPSLTNLQTYLVFACLTRCGYVLIPIVHRVCAKTSEISPMRNWFDDGLETHWPTHVFERLKSFRYLNWKSDDNRIAASCWSDYKESDELSDGNEKFWEGRVAPLLHWSLLNDSQVSDRLRRVSGSTRHSRPGCCSRADFELRAGNMILSADSTIHLFVRTSSDEIDMVRSMITNSLNIFAVVDGGSVSYFKCAIVHLPQNTKRRPTKF